VSEQISQQLLWVSGELGSTLRDARLALEEYVEQPEQVAAMQRCAKLLHQAHGALRIAEVYGASLLADEMEQLAVYLYRHAAGATLQAEGLDALSRAIVQLPAYMERVVSGARDIPLVLLPLLNDLRAARGSPLLSENTLLLLNLPSDRHLLASGARPQASGEDIVKLARRLRPRYQAALLAWIRGERPDSSLAVIADVAASLERASAESSVFQLWWVLGGVIEALRQGGLSVSASVKRLLGQVDRQIRRLIDEGEAGVAAAPPVELLNSLLFYVARSTTRGSRVGAIRGAFSLGDLLPDQDSLAEARDSLGGPSVQLMHTVANAIREDLAKVKDALDLHARTGKMPAEGLDAQFQMLAKIGDTLGVLGLGDLRDEVQQESERLRAALALGEAATEEELMAVAAALLRVEDRLDQRLVRLVVEEPAADDTIADASDTEQRTVTEALLRECLINMARIRDAISERLAGPVDPQLADTVPELMKAVTAGLLILERPRAVAVLERITVHVRHLLEPGATEMRREALDRLADAIVSVEYFMETIQAGRKDPLFMLENAESCLDAIPVLESPVPEFEAVTEPPDATVRLWEKPAVITPPPAEPAVPVFSGEERPDTELLELFIEEAKELEQVISSRLPAWQAEPQKLEELGTVRRCFHTLKGSGRMVGARLFGEYAWAVERLMNGLLERRIEPSEPIVRFLARAATHVAPLIEQLESGRSPAVDIDAWIVQANAFADSRPDAADTLKVLLAPPAEAAPPAPVEAPSEMDPVLRDIFTREAAGHLEELRRFLRSCSLRTAPYVVTEAAHRASHTLAGSANMADVAPAVAVTRPLNEFLRRLHDDHAGLSEAGLKVVRRAADAVAQVVDALRDGRPPGPADESLAAEIRRLHEDYQLRAEAGAAERPATEEELDPEILALFCEEAAEILEEAQGAMAQWRAQPGAGDPLRALQRHLHTVKGGARLAGLRNIGDLSHQLESLFESLAEGRRQTEPGLVELVQDCLDALHYMRDAAAEGRMPDPPLALMQRLDAALAGEAPEPAVPEEAEPRAEPPSEAPPELPPEMEEAPPAETPPEVEAEAPAETPPEVEAGPPAEAPAEGEPEAEPEPAVEAFEADTWFGEVFDSPDEPQAEVPAEVPTGFPPPMIEFPPEAPAEPPFEPPSEGFGEFPPPAVEPPPEPAEEPEPAVEAPEFTAPEMETPAEAEAETAAEAPAEAATPALPELPAPAEPARPATPFVPPRQEVARVDAELLEALLNNAGEVGIYRSRLEEQLGSVQFNLEELAATVVRLREQLRKMEIETETQIIHGHQGDMEVRGEFDPLELDRYSTIQQLSRALVETASDVASIQQLISERAREAENLIVQQSRAVSELQDGLMKTRLVPFNRHAQRLSRLVRQAASEYGRRAELQVVGGTTELDRQIMDRMLGPLEHLLRNAVIHGIETPEQRHGTGKPETGQVTASVRREGAEIVVEVSDDGAGLNIAAIRNKAIALGLLRPDAELVAEDAATIILRPGFSTARELTQGAGRGVGMDVVASEVRQLGGVLQVRDKSGHGATFEIRLPFTRAITQALVLRAGEEWFALPLPAVEGVVRVPANELPLYLGQKAIPYRYGDDEYVFEHIGGLIGGHALPPPETGAVPAILVRAGDRPTALLTDEMLGAREIVVKPLGPQLTGLPGISGATILGDGRIVLILDIAALIRARARLPDAPAPGPLRPKEDDRTFVMVVDDSITVRRVTERLLERNGMRVITAKDGVDAVSLLQDHMPDIMLLDIEMPRMDGYEVASHVRNDPRLQHIPIVMITSRVGDKHRSRALDLGVNHYLGKPYQESDLLTAISSLVGRDPGDTGHD
jgi:chemosensory pili system protein ChpA (sensor histidine kinase/response regulator)